MIRNIAIVLAGGVGSRLGLSTPKQFFKVAGKMFLCVDLEHTDYACMKCDPDYALELRDRYAGIDGAYHFNKKHWNQVAFHADVSDALFIELVNRSYHLVVSKLPRRLREGLQ